MSETLFDEDVTISFKTTATVTPRTTVVAEAFGLGIDDEKTFTIYDKMRLTIRRGDVVFITGDSGGGKSCLMKLLQRRLNEKTITFMSMEDHEIPPVEILVENVGDTIEKALEILTRAGLGDAFLMLRKYEQLSDGQKYRYKIAKMINSDVDVWFIDEFCAKLDRETAKVISYSIQKVARTLNKTLIVATTHDDIQFDLNPNVVVRKDFGGGVTVKREMFVEHLFSLIPKIEYQASSYDEYEKSGLADFHYKSHARPVGLINVFAAKYKGEVIGALLTKHPPLELQERNHITNKYYTKNYKELNKDVETISRVVIHPKFRGIGLGSRLVQKYLESTMPRKIVETIAVMARYNPFFERAGMTRIKIERKKQTKHYRDTMESLTYFMFDADLMRSKRYNEAHLDALHVGDLRKLTEKIMKEYHKVVALYSTAKSKTRQAIEAQMTAATESPADYVPFIAEALTKIRKPDLAYFIWFNPKFKHDYAKTKVAA